MYNHPKVRLMIVDDIANVRRDLKTVLLIAGSAAGMDIEITAEARDGMDAIRLARSNLPDVILMDLEMPVMDGFSATRIIKEQLPSTKIIALTVHGDAQSREEAYRAGVDHYIEKGAPVNEIVRAIQMLEKKEG
ncbi:MAG: response regulator [Chloroflexi bacterium]|nr:MAG: response regulator [Chloroflexota bacterium]